MLKKSLGRNIENLFSTKATTKISSPLVVEPHHEIVKMVALTHIQPSVFQPRTEFDDAKIQELASSIEAQGVIQPIILKIDQYGAYEIIAGERRFRAAKLAGLKKIPAIIRNYSDKDASFVALIENIQREDLNPIDRAEAVAKIASQYKLKQQDIAEILGISRAQLTNTLRLLKVHQRVREALLQKIITEGHAKVLAGIAIEEQPFYCIEIEKKHLSVRQLEETIAKKESKEGSYSKLSHSAIDPYYEKIKRVIEEFFLTKVDVADNGKGKGKIVLYYNSYDELSGLLAKVTADKEVF